MNHVKIIKNGVLVLYTLRFLQFNGDGLKIDKWRLENDKEERKRESTLIFFSLQVKIHIISYWGPLPPSGGVQTIFCVGSLISQALQ